jgi:hypothetical protein
VEVSGIADGGLFALGAAWPWVIHVGGTIVGRLKLGALWTTLREDLEDYVEKTETGRMLDAVKRRA